MQVDNALIVSLAQALTWPLIALIALFVLRKHIVTLAKGATHLNEALGKGGDVVSLLDRLVEVQGAVDRMKDEVEETKGMLEAISIRDKVGDLRALASQNPNLARPGASPLATDEMYQGIEAAWREVADVIRRISLAADVKSNLTGTKGVSATLDALLSRGAISSQAADLTKALSSQWQWIWRTTAPREDWLSHQVFTSFVDGAKQAKELLTAKAP